MFRTRPPVSKKPQLLSETGRQPEIVFVEVFQHLNRPVSGSSLKGAWLSATLGYGAPR
jgi:hypothetical protein